MPEGGATARPHPPASIPPATESSPVSSTFQGTEAKILSGSFLSLADIAGFSQPELKLLRNTVYARHGRPFQTAELRQYFAGRSWYSSKNTYSDTDLTSNDKANVKLIQRAENP
jgi:hypothetical protein